MAKILDMPKLSPTMEEGVLSAWHKKEGDTVEVDDLLAEVETDKATMEFRAFDRGTILKLLVPAGANVKLGQPVAVLGSPGEDISGLAGKLGAVVPAAPATAPNLSAAATATATATATPTATATATATTTPTTTPTPTPTTTPTRTATVDKGNPLTRTERDAPSTATRENGGRVLASPYIRKAARDRGIDLQGATGTGPGGRIVAGDLERIGAAPAPAAAANGSRAVVVASAQAPLAVVGLAEPEVRPLSMMRKTIARRLVESKQTVPHFYLTIDVNAEALVRMRESINAELARGGGGSGGGSGGPEGATKISVNDLLIKACATALARVPECNAQFAGDSILIHKRVDISVAVAVPDGLVTPVVRNADQKTIVAIGREVRDLAGRARAKKLRPEEMSNGTFSISNLGMFGIDAFSAVINPPEGAILAVGQTRDVPVVKDGVVAAGKMLSMTLSCDHRVIDGAVGAAFLAELRGLLEHPMRILTG